MRGHHERGDKKNCIRGRIEVLDESKRHFGDARLDVDESS